jgi:SAM-dependent methyltransferase
VNERYSFDKVAEIYDRVRPSYPAELFSDMLAYVGAPEGSRLRALEVGPGTGQATASLLERGIEVTAIELGANLAALLREKFREDARLTVVNAPFEEAAVERRAYDLVTSATAFHWVDPAIRWLKARDALRPGGAVAIIETNQIRSDVDRRFFDDLHPIILKHRPDEQWNDELPGEDVTPPLYKDLDASGLFTDVALRRYRWDQTYSTAQYADLTRSYGSTGTMEPGPREAMIAEICELVDRRYGGAVTRPLVVTLTLGRKRD